MQNTEILIVPMTVEFAQDMAALEAICFSLPWTVQMCKDELTNPIARYIAAVDAHDPHKQTHLVGYAGIQYVLDEGYITNVAVAPEKRRLGLGRRILSALLNDAHEAGLSFVTLEARISNQPALALYKEMGFKVVGQRPGYYERPKEDALLLTLRFL